ncbi:alpha-2-macroglobulin family protein [Chitinophaga rhizophila]|uniref:Alpha-2-macroglobulin n=1 Tax=Chitinophaga rhizophila TaxID=2866212 RepID=A0ABS7GFU5_9BACT|nr:alpha-2-macroglobulin family protein [Chitinophaga rhizophila]MBW8686562.1 alpha-2-macroglobulin [Chitinophaga rhizophila]
MAQFNYDTQWKKVSELESKSFYRAAFEALDVISANAIKEKNEPQLLKTYIYRVKYTGYVDIGPSDGNKAWRKQAFSPISYAVLKSMQAELLMNYLRNHRYELYSRTDVPGDTSRDVDTWSEERLHREITAAYEASLQDAAVLKKTDISQYHVILTEGSKEGRAVRSTLYDLLAHRALDYYKSGESLITSPENQFELTDAAAFAPAAEFVNHTFTTTDSTSLQFKALLILQELMRLHANNKTALLEVDLERTLYIHQVGIMPDKDELYLKLLKSQEKEYTGEKEVAKFIHLLAEYYHNESNKKEPGMIDGMTASAASKYAKELCEKGKAIAPGYQGSTNCANLLISILQKQLELQTELVNLPGVPFRSLVSYRNTDKLYLRVISINEAFRSSLRAAQRDYRDTTHRYWRLMLEKQPVKSWEQTLTGSEDYLQHAAEIKVDGLPLGMYVVLASVKSNFSLEDNLMAIQFIHVSNISYVLHEFNADDIINRFYTLHRQSGQPLPNTKLNVWSFNDDGKKEKLQLVQTYTTDKEGKIDVKWSNLRQDVKLEWISGNDQLYLDDHKYVYNYKYQQESEGQEENYKSFLFTDRAIYRPGQTMHFKGIMLSKNGKGATIVADKAAVVLLKDTEGQTIEEIRLTTNEFGAFSGRFTLPSNRLNGEFSIEETNTDAEVSFSVEEYKRPKFYVEFAPVRGTYRVNDSVKVTAKAIAYAGNNITGAKVEYRIVRNTRFPYPWLMWRSPYRGTTREITHGQSTTGADGTFSVTFPALPDNKVPASQKPVFTYTVSATITDINGETHSEEQLVNAGYQALEIDIELPDRVTAKTLDSVKLVTQNLNGVFEAANVKVVVNTVKPPSRLLRARYWRKPDQFVMSQAEFQRLFPNDIYNDENKQESWERAGEMSSLNVTTVENAKVKLVKGKLDAGWYEVQVSTKDKYGEEVVQKKLFEVVDPAAKKPAYPSYIWKYAEGGPIEPGAKKQIKIGSAANDVHVLQLFQQQNKQEVFSSFTLNNSIANRDYDVQEADRGNVVFQYAFVKDNRIYLESETVNVPWTNKQLDITIGTHRDKLQPGEKEKWQVKIKGYKGEQVAAEMLATMYDASLDEFRKHAYTAPFLDSYLTPFRFWAGNDNFRGVYSQEYNNIWQPGIAAQIDQTFDQIDWEGNEGGSMGDNAYLLVNKSEKDAAEVRIVGYATNRKKRMMSSAVARSGSAEYNKLYDSAPMPAAPVMAVQAENIRAAAVDMESEVLGGAAEQATISKEKVQPRKNFNETAFFMPALRTDKDGNISFEFTVPEALTRWHFLSLAHTKEAAFGTAESSIVTQKALMVQPNAPRFMREGDKIEFSAKISNLADKQLRGEARLELLDAATMQPVDGWFQNLFPVQHFTVEKEQSTAVSFPVQIPFNFNSSLVYRIIATADKYSDGEESALPVLTNTMLVTETMPLSMRGDGTRTFTMPKMLKSGESETLQQHSFTLEYTSNPAWNAVQALPYLMEYPYECSEQIFNRYYANTLASYISNAAPGVKAIFEKWRTTDTAALLSNLQKNEELKSVLLQETPWVLEAKNEAAQKSKIALLFDLQRMSGEQQKAIEQLKDRQLSSGAFPWFNGMWADRYITQYILAGIGRLQELKALDAETNDDVENIVTKGLAYADRETDASYNRLKQQKVDMNQQHIGPMEVHYLYTRRLLKQVELPNEYREAYQYYITQAKKYWPKLNINSQAMLAIVFKRSADVKTATEIIASLKDRAIVNRETGMSWKDLTGGYWWYEAPVETQAMLIAAFQEVTNDATAIGDMKTWLLKNKQTNSWPTTKSTADACYAMLLGGENWLSTTAQVSLKAGALTVSSEQEKTEAGTGYFKKRLNTTEVKPDMGTVTVTVKDSKGQPSWGAAYWQYFEQLDKITSAATPLQLQKELFIEKNTEKGPVLTAVTDGNSLKVGSKVKSRIILRVDRDMEYVHLKDMRAACFEPTSVLSESKWQNGVSYYESTKDASTNFFFSRLPRGTYVFEYTLFVTHQGNFSNGISTAQCMYAPEFSAHSEGIRVKVTE